MTATVADIDLGPGLRKLVDLWIGEVRLGMRRFWRGGAHENTPTSRALPLLNRLIRILRCVFVLLAVHLPALAPVKPRGRGRRAAAPVRTTAFPMFARFRVTQADAGRPQPAALARAGRDRWLATRRKLDVLARALASPMAIVKRMARRLPTQLMVFGWTRPKRTSPRARRDFWEMLEDAHREARFHLSAWRRRRRFGATAAPGS
jgi:hypothetical protein